MVKSNADIGAASGRYNRNIQHIALQRLTIIDRAAVRCGVWQRSLRRLV